jgi:hypothetical protein
MEPGKEHYTVTRMCPMKNVKAFFTKGKNKYFTISTAQTLKLDTPINVRMGKKLVPIDLPQCNIFSAQAYSPIFTAYYTPAIRCRPRTQLLDE